MLVPVRLAVRAWALCVNPSTPQLRLSATQAARLRDRLYLWPLDNTHGHEHWCCRVNWAWSICAMHDYAWRGKLKPWSCHICMCQLKMWPMRAHRRSALQMPDRAVRCRGVDFHCG